MSKIKAVIAGMFSLSVLGVLFIILKLLGLITWSWWFVTLPICTPFYLALYLLGIFFSIIISVFTVFFIRELLFGKKGRQKRMKKAFNLTQPGKWN